MALSWNVLVVDDELDVHNITKLALKRKTWRERPIVLTSAMSGKEAREILQAPNAPRFDCALVDVVMETNDAGLLLCDFIRANIPHTTRLILRTGQPGAAPADQVLNDYDIDYYLAKTEVTPERLFVTLRACFRSSQDISALLAVSAQLNAFTVALQDVNTTQETLAGIMTRSLNFLQEKYAATVVFVHDQVKEKAPAEALAAVAMAHEKKLPPMELHAGADLGLAGSYVVTTTQLASTNRAVSGVGDKVKRWFQNLLAEEAKEAAVVGLVIRFEHDLPSKMLNEFQRDLELFVTNWRMAESSLRLQDKLVRDRMETVRSNFGTA